MNIMLEKQNYSNTIMYDGLRKDIEGLREEFDTRYVHYSHTHRTFEPIGTLEGKRVYSLSYIFSQHLINVEEKEEWQRQELGLEDEESEYVEMDVSEPGLQEVIEEVRTF